MRFPPLTFCLISILLIALSITPEKAGGVTHHVPSSYATIQLGINAAGPGDTVLVAGGTYIGAGNRDLDFGGINIVLLSESGPLTTIIDCQESGRGIIFQNAESSASVFDGFTITRGDTAVHGGAIYVDTLCAPTIRHCRFYHNKSTDYYTSVAYLKGSPALADCTFDYNTTTLGLSSVMVWIVGDVTFTDCVFSNNQSIYSMIIQEGFHNPEFTRCTIRDNFAELQSLMTTSSVFNDCLITGNTTGGSNGMFGTITSYGATFIDCEFTGNTSERGGGVGVADDTSTFLRCTISGNTATDAGGGVCLGHQAGCNATFTDCLITGNTSAGRGGGVYVYIENYIAGMTYRFANTTITGNHAGGGGGGVSIEQDYVIQADTSLIFENSILWGNCSDTGPNELYETKTMMNTNEIIFACSDVDTSEVITDANVYYGLNTIDADPMFCGPAPCASAPTTAGDYSLDYGSPCTAGNSPCGQLMGAVDVGCGEVGIISVPGRPAGYALWQNSPNPFNPVTRIRFDLAETGRTELKIYDVSGRLIRTLVSGKLPRDRYTVDWNGRDDGGRPVASGVYFYRLKAGNYTSTKKMLLLK